MYCPEQVDPLLTVGGPASSDCWGNNLAGSTCYGGHPRPTAEDLLSTVGQNWALGIVEYGAKHGVRVDFSSSHSYSSPCGNATSLHEEFKMFADVIHRSSLCLSLSLSLSLSLTLSLSR